MKYRARPIALWILLVPCLAGAVEVTAKSAIVVQAATGKVLWAKDAETPRFPASTTKVMTSLLLVERTRPNEIVVAPKEVEGVGQSSMNLKPGERVRSRDLLYAIMLRSANDGAYAAAIHMAGSIPAFCDVMNARAKQLGCTATRFCNPNGLNDPQHVTSAHDLARIAMAAMRYPEFREVARTTKKLIERSTNVQDRWMINRNKWLWKDPTADGIKTGWTVPAGHCYVGSAMREDFRVVTAILKSDNWQEDHRQLLDYAYKTYSVGSRYPKDRPVGSVAVQGGVATSVPVGPVAGVYSLVKTGDARKTQAWVYPDAGLAAPIRRGQRVGRMVVIDPEGFEQKVNLVALEDVPATPWRTGGRGILFLAGTLGIGTWYVRKRVRRAPRRNAKKARRLQP